MEEKKPNRNEQYYSAIKILAKDESWPYFKAWLREQILGVSAMNSSPIITEEDKAKHNGRIGMLAAFKLVMDIDRVIDNLDEFERNMEKRTKEAEEQFRKRG